MIASRSFAQFRAEHPEFFAKIQLVVELQAFASRLEFEMLRALDFDNPCWQGAAEYDFYTYLDSELKQAQTWT